MISADRKANPSLDEGEMADWSGKTRLSMDTFSVGKETWSCRDSTAGPGCRKCVQEKKVYKSSKIKLMGSLSQRYDLKSS